MRFELVGWPEAGPKLALDYRVFSYAGKFVTTNTGKAVALADSRGSDTDPASAPPHGDELPPPATAIDGAVDPDGLVLGAVAFNADRTDDDVWWLRYVTVRADRRGEGIGPRLVSFATERLGERGAKAVRIAVNNPYAYEAAYRAGFAFTGETTGLAELVCVTPAEATSQDRYQEGLDHYRERDLTPDETEFLASKEHPPETVDVPD